MTEFLDFPPPTYEEAYRTVYALGRTTAAWGELEHQFFCLFAAVKASSTQPVGKTQEERPVRELDFVGVAAIYFSQDSSRGRRQMVTDLTRSRYENKFISKGLYDAIKDTSAAAQKSAKKRNELSHCKLNFLKNGTVEIQAEDTIVNPLLKRRRPASEIDATTEQIRRVSKRVFKLVVFTLETPLDQPPPWLDP